MGNEKQLLWIIPNSDYTDINLNDGEPIFFPYIIGTVDHGSRAKEFCINYNFTNYPPNNSHNDWGKYFTDKGFAVFFNSGVMLENKYFGCWYLPNELTIKQIDFLEKQKELFYEKYNSHPSFFRSFVNTDKDIGYQSPNGFRDLKIEALINNQTPNNGIDILYNEIVSQKINQRNKQI